MSQRFNPGGGSNYQSAPTTALTSTTAFSFCGWVYLVSGGVNGDVIYADPVGGAFSAYAWVGWDAGNWVFLQNNASNASVYNYQVAFTTGVWTHLTMVFDGTSTFSYINGTLANSAASAVGARGAFDLIAIGVNAADATLQDCKVFASALSAADVAREMRASKPSRTAYIWWPLFAGAPGTVDLSGNARTLSGLGNSDGLLSAPCMWSPNQLTQLLYVATGGGGTALTSIACATVTAASGTLSTPTGLSSVACATVTAMTGTLTNSVPLSSTACATVTAASGTLTNTVPLSSTACATVTAASGTLSTPTGLASTACATVTAASGTISTPTALASTACATVTAATGQLNVFVPLVGTACATVTAFSGTVSVDPQLVSTACATVTAASGTLSTPTGLTSTACATVTAFSGTINTGNSALTSIACATVTSATGTLSTPTGLTSTACATVTSCTGVLTNSVPLISVACATVTAANGNMSVAKSIDGTACATVTAMFGTLSGGTPVAPVQAPDSGSGRRFYSGTGRRHAR